MEKNRGVRPVIYIPPMTKQEKENFIKAWKSAIPKVSKVDWNPLPFLTGTPGKEVENPEQYEWNLKEEEAYYKSGKK